MQLKKVENPAHIRCGNSNQLLMLAYKTLNPYEKPDASKRCRFDMFVRLAPGNVSPFKDQKRSWCFRGDKFTDDPPRMLRNLLNLLKKRISIYDRIIIYDNHNRADEREIVRIIDGVIERNELQKYAMLLTGYPIPDFLRMPRDLNI